jgi:proline dehydrogenase
VLEGEEGLKEGDLNKLDGLWGTLKRVGEAAREEGIKVAVDAEHSWYQVGLFCGLDTGS